MGSRRNLMLRNELSLTNGHFQRARSLGRGRYWTFVAQGLVAVVIGSSGCSGSPPADTCNGNSVAGGTGTDPCGTGGAVNVGGSTAVGGTVNTGGAAPTGGSVSTGGTADTGGTVSTGGTADTGGSAAGGASDTGGTVSTGGAMPTGGSVSTGGMSATGGAGGTGAPPQAILQYKFEDVSGTTALDSTTNHNDGSLTSVTWSTSGRNGGSVNYALADSVITAPSGFLGSAHALTISAWVNLTAASAAESRLFYFGGTGTYLTLVLNNSLTPAGISLRFQGPTGAERVLTTPTQLPSAVWKHITVTVSSAGSAIYVDGKIVARDNTLAIDPATLGTPTSNLVGSSPTAGQAFQGLLDEFYVYDGVLALSDIQQLAWPKTDYSIYHMDEGTGTTVADSSSRAINGTLAGNATWVTAPFGKGIKLSNDASVTPAAQYVDLADGIVTPCTTSLTLSGWFSLTTNNPDAPFIEIAADSTKLFNITTYASDLNKAVFSFGFLNGSGTRTFRLTTYTWLSGTWTHVAATRNGNTITLYQDGAKRGTGTAATGFVMGNSTLNFFGKSSNDAKAGFNGSIDEILISCRAYTDDEIKQLAYLPLGGG